MKTAPTTALALIADATRRKWVRIVRVEVIEFWDGLGGMVRDPIEGITYVLPLARLASRRTVSAKLRAFLNSRPVTAAPVEDPPLTAEAGTEDGGAWREDSADHAWYRDGQYA